MYPRERKTYAHTKTRIQMFIAALFVIAKRWKQPIWPSADEWINGMCHTHRMEYLGGIKSNQVSKHVATWVNVKDIRLSERS